MRDESPLQINLLLVHKLKSSNPIGELVIERALRLQEWFSRKCDRQVIVFEIQSNWRGAQTKRSPVVRALVSLGWKCNGKDRSHNLNVHYPSVKSEGHGNIWCCWKYEVDEKTCGAALTVMKQQHSREIGLWNKSTAFVSSCIMNHLQPEKYGLGHRFRSYMYFPSFGDIHFPRLGSDCWV